MKIAMLVLAAGKASRMGSVKQLLPYKNSSILGTVLESSIKVFNSEDIYVVLGANAQKIKENLRNYTVNYIINEDFASGLSSSIYSGVTKLSNYDAILIALGDQPKIDVTYINEMVTLHQENKEFIVASRYDGFNGVPAVFPKTFYPKLLNLTGDKGAKQLLNSELNFIKTVASSGKLLDIDTPEDYQKLINP
ncbi:nucleotidyltransferase family protein [uncultured Tenacibaculum sp.]|uniref:nucleotidyltransferase family protein n=1 Tax=uncultured Tenacibaculum sp. TaxID=174713 RepID=UPI002626345E|nr:nucleotidyltransferase family protein [uncultured Tenacibaculum sp.]